VPNTASSTEVYPALCNGASRVVNKNCKEEEEEEEDRGVKCREISALKCI
jgi:hypothetical protein